LKDVPETSAMMGGDAFTLNLANSIWCQEGYTVNSDYLDLLRDYYHTGLKLVDFIHSPEKAREAINRWVSKETNDKIKDLISPGGVHDMTRLVLANAIYFYAGWVHPFMEHRTHKEDFTLLDGGKVRVSMMELVERFKYHQGRGFQAVSLPYVGQGFEMLVLLPELKSFKEFESKLDAKLITKVISKLKRKKVELSFPKFKFDAMFSLKEVLISMGMEDAFTNDADFTGIEDSRRLFIDNVFHKAVIDVDEKGTEAAAATAVMVAAKAIGLTPPEKVYRFNADHPFIFLIYNTTTESILFLGRVLNPS
jgi:serpin B